jgi:CRP-like cAMP-binding protein
MASTTNDLDIAHELRQVGAFAELGKDALAELALASTQRRVHAGLAIVDQGVASPALTILVRGAAKVVRTTRTDKDESTVVLDVMRAPCIVADSSVIDGAPALASVVTLRSSHVVSIDRRAVMRLLQLHPLFARALLTRFAQEVRGGVRRVDEIVAGPVDERVVNLLDSLAQAHGTPLGAGRFIAIPLRRRDLANMVNATTETVSRLLAKFEREGQARSTRDGIWWRSAQSVSKVRVVPSLPVTATPPNGTPIIAHPAHVPHVPGRQGSGGA